MQPWRFSGLFVSGTDTMVGKTVVAAGLVRSLAKVVPTAYWKPVQTGTSEDDDRETARRLAGDATVLPPGYAFAAPLSPHLAARLEGRVIEAAWLQDQWKNTRATDRFTVVEGAGGLLVPFGPAGMQIDQIARLELPVVLVVEDRLGAINHTLLSLEACERRAIAVVGVILNRVSGRYGNAESLREFAKVPVLAEIPVFENAEKAAQHVGNHPALRAQLADYFRLAASHSR